MRLKSVRVYLALLTAVLASDGHAQSFDIVGVQPGMKTSEAVAALRLHNPGLRVVVRNFGLQDSPNDTYEIAIDASENRRRPGGSGAWQREMLQVGAIPSGRDSIVTAIRRTFTYQHEDITTWDNFVSAVKAKYGEPSESFNEGYWKWNFDANGKVQPGKRATCNGGNEIAKNVGNVQSFQGRMRTPEPAIAWGRSCGKILVIIASRSTSNPTLVAGGDSYLVDGILDAQLTESLSLRLQGRASAKQREQTKDAERSGKPRM